MPSCKKDFRWSLFSPYGIALPVGHLCILYLDPDAVVFQFVRDSNSNGSKFVAIEVECLRGNRHDNPVCLGSGDLAFAVQNGKSGGLYLYFR